MKGKDKKESLSQNFSDLSLTTPPAASPIGNTERPVKVLSEFFVSSGGEIRFGLKPPSLVLPREGDKLPSVLRKDLFGSELKELPPMEKLFDSLLQGPTGEKLASVIFRSPKQKIIFSRRRLVKELWLRGNVSELWDRTLTSTMHGVKRKNVKSPIGEGGGKEESVDILFVDVDSRGADVENRVPAEALEAEDLFRQMCVKDPLPYGFFTLSCYSIGNFLLLLSGDVDCKDEEEEALLRKKEEKKESTEEISKEKQEKELGLNYVELNLSSLPPQNFALSPPSRRRLWVGMDLGGYGKLIRGHRNKDNNTVDILTVDTFEGLSTQLEPKPQPFRRKMEERLKLMWNLFDRKEDAYFQAQDFVS